ncbi:hypothetical protein ACEN4K_09040 [Marinilactibacillus psychrotolerans]|uniref:hypothetical protein n=1 Tax=Marinilactibacillus psychrotolerans TaxID=191770 RepID=UPI00388A3BD8
MFEEEEKRKQRVIARKFQKIGKEIGLDREVSENSYKFPSKNEVLAAKEWLEKEAFECSVSFSWARLYLLGMNFSFTHIHISKKTRLYNDVLNQNKIFLNSYFYPALLDD